MNTQVPAAWCVVTVPCGSWKMSCLGENAFSALQQVGPQVAGEVWFNGQTLFSCPEDKGQQGLLELIIRFLVAGASQGR